MSTPLFALAHHYRELGWPCFPCRPATEEIVDPATGEITTKTEKSPYTVFGLRDATKNERILTRWWTDWPQAVVGIPTGSPIGAWVLDVDLKSTANGYETLAVLEDIHGELPETAIVQTANGGRHYYWRHVDGVRNRGGLGPGLDVRGDGGYVIAPGSAMSDGRSYQWLDYDGDGVPPIADAPQWLLDLVLPKPYEPVGSYSGRLVSAGENPAYVDAAVAAELADLAATVAGQRGTKLNKTAFALGQFVPHIPRAEAEAELYAAAVANGLVKTDGDKACRDTIRRGLDAGQRNPRQVPEPQRIEPVDISGMLRKAQERLSAQPGASTPPAAVGPDAAVTDAPPTAAAATTPPAPQRALTATPFIYRDPSLIPRREFIYGKHYVRKYLTATFGAGGGGKSANAVSEALAMCTGRPLLGGMLQEPVRVWYINAEDDPVEIERRFAAAIKHFGIKPNQIADRLYTDSGRIQEFVVMKEDGKRTRVCEPVVRAFRDEVREKRIDVAIVDPFVSTHEVEENDNSKIQRVATQWVLIAEEAGCAIELIHHVTKGNIEITADSGRGAGALKDKCRSVRTINGMSEAEALDAGIPSADRYSYFRVDAGKANMAKRSGVSDWRRFVSVKLGNGKGNMAAINGDEIGVVTAWEWPSSEKIAENSLTDEQMHHLKTTLDNGSYKAAANAKEWAGLAVAYVMGADADDKAARKRAGTILKALLKEGVLAEVTERDPITRMASRYIKSADFDVQK